MTATAAPCTFQHCEIDTKEGRAFLRRVARDNEKFGDDRWSCGASPETGWRLTFRRTIRGGLGVPDTYVEVRTDVEVRKSGRTGQVQSFHDSDPVTVFPPARLYVSDTYTGTVAKLLTQRRSRLAIECSAGSTNSSRHGLVFYALTFTSDDLPGALTIGGDTVAKDGRIICSGTVEI